MSMAVCSECSGLYPHGSKAVHVCVWDKKVEESKIANSNQVDGDHYKNRAIQPWDFIASNKLDFFEGNVIKLTTRWKEKGGTKDLHKAIHYLQKLIELNVQESLSNVAIDESKK